MGRYTVGRWNLCKLGPTPWFSRIGRKTGGVNSRSHEVVPKAPPQRKMKLLCAIRPPCRGVVDDEKKLGLMTAATVGHWMMITAKPERRAPTRQRPRPSSTTSSEDIFHQDLTCFARSVLKGSRYSTKILLVSYRMTSSSKDW